MSAPDPLRAADDLTVSDLVDLAWDYEVRGDFWGAARCLRTAASKMQKRARFRRLSIPPEQRP